MIFNFKKLYFASYRGQYVYLFWLAVHMHVYHISLCLTFICLISTTHNLAKNFAWYSKIDYTLAISHWDNFSQSLYVCGRFHRHEEARKSYEIEHRKSDLTQDYINVHIALGLGLRFDSGQFFQHFWKQRRLKLVKLKSF